MKNTAENEIIEIREILKEAAIIRKETESIIKSLSISQKETESKLSISQKEIESRLSISQKEIESKLSISQKEIESRLSISKIETENQCKETDKKIKQAFDLFEGQWGKLVESLVEGDIVRLLQERGLAVHDTSMRRKGNHEGENFEFDIIVHNGDSIVIVEVKTTLRVKHVKEFIPKLKKASLWLDEYRNYKVYGAVAFLRAEEKSDVFAESESLFVIRATGNSAKIINRNGFEAKAF